MAKKKEPKWYDAEVNGAESIVTLRPVDNLEFSIELTPEGDVKLIGDKILADAATKRVVEIEVTQQDGFYTILHGGTLDDKRPKPEAPEPVVFDDEDAFEFRARLTGVQTKATKEGTRKVIRLETSYLRILRLLDEHMELTFDVTMLPSFGSIGERKPPEKGEGEQAELPLSESDGPQPGEQNDGQPEQNPNGEVVPKEQPPDESPEKSDVTEGEASEDATLAGWANPNFSPDDMTDYCCDVKGCEVAGDKGTPVRLTKRLDDNRFLDCPKCGKVYANPDYEETEM